MNQELQDWIENVAKENGGMLTMDGFDDCIVGLIYDTDGNPHFVYDRDAVIQKLIDEGMSGDEAEEYHEFNQAGAYVGPTTPLFMDLAPV